MSKLWSVGLVVAIIATLVTAIPTSASTLSWGTETIPSSTNNQLASGTDILDIAVASNGTTIYAVTGATGSKAYKSTDGGVTWTGLTSTSIPSPANLITVAPDDTDRVVILGGANNLTAVVSTNGGSSFSSLGTVTGTGGAATALYDVTISVASSGIRYIGAAGTYATLPLDDLDNTPGFFYFDLGAAAPAWKNAVNDFTTPLTIGEIDAIRAIAFSPNFASDKTAVSVTESIGTAGPKASAATLHVLSFASKSWDATAGFSGYPVNIVTTTNVATSVGRASIALAPDYLGADETLRIAFVGLQITDSTTPSELGGLFRLSDTSLKNLKSGAVYSVAYNGTNLVAGQTTDGTGTASNNVFRSADMLASSPTVSSARSFKKPGGVDGVVVAFAGTNVVAGTKGAESAFAISRDNGASFNDISLIDTTTAAIIDVAVTPDGAIIYLLTDDGAATSLFRKQNSAWERVYVATPSAAITLVRTAPDNNNVVYLVKQGTSTMYYSNDAAQTKWTIRASGASSTLDLAVEGGDVAYIAATGSTSIYKSTNAGFTWGSGVDTKLSGGNVATVNTIAKDNLVVGSDAGYVSYSTDGNTTWTNISTALNVAGNVQVTADGLAAGNFIYAATDGAGTRVERWKIGTSTSWSNLTAPTAAAPYTAYGVYGIALAKGAIFAVASDGTDSALFRTLNPTDDNPNWGAVQKTGITLDDAPKALVVSTGSVKLWAIDTTAPALKSFTDTLVDVSIALVSPADKFQNTVNPVTGRSVDIAFTWTKPSDNVTDYQIAIYTDKAATQLIQDHTFNNTNTTVVVLMGPFQSSTRQVEFSPGATYYWRVRVAATGPLYSNWSAIRTFSIMPGAAAVPTILSPANGAVNTAERPSFSWSPVSGTTSYQLQIADNIAMSPTIADVTVNTTGYVLPSDFIFSKTYYWRVRATVPVQGDWSPLANFTIMPEPKAPTTPPPPVVITQVPPPVISIPPAPVPPPAITIPPAPAPVVPAFIWATIIIGAVLVIAVIVLIVRTRRPS